MIGQFSVLVIDSDRKRNDEICAYLKENDFQCTSVKTLKDYEERFENHAYDGIVLEDNFATINTTRFLVDNKRNGRAITIVVSDTLNEEYLESLLDAGADDYITIPFTTHDLMKKIQAVYKNGILKPRTIYRFKDIIMDVTAHTVFVNDHALTLTKNEFKLLKLLISHPYQPYTSTALFEAIWGNAVYEDTSSVPQLIGSLARKLNLVGSDNEYIKRFGRNSYKMAI